MRYGVMRYSKGDMVEIDSPGSPFHERVGKVIFTDHESLRVDVAPLWYWGEGDVKPAEYESIKGLVKYPAGTIVVGRDKETWVKISDALWASEAQKGYRVVSVISSESLVYHKVTRTFLGKQD